MLIRDFVDEGLGNTSYLVASEATGLAAVIDPERDVDRYFRVAEGLGRVKRSLHMGIYYELPPGGLDGPTPGGAELAALGRGPVPAVLAGFKTLSYPQMRVEIEAMVELAG